MENKEIYIDGVDVSGCCHQGKDNTCTCPHYKKECGKNPNCHYKIMQRQTKKLDKFYKSELELKQKLFRKEQECEGLRYEIGSLENDRDILQEKLDQLKQTIAEIKEIVFPKNQLIITDSPIILKIQEKIGECEANQ